MIHLNDDDFAHPSDELLNLIESRLRCVHRMRMPASQKHTQFMNSLYAEYMDSMGRQTKRIAMHTFQIHADEWNKLNDETL